MSKDVDLNLKYWLGFNLVKGIGPAKLKVLIDRFGDVEGAWRASDGDLAALGLDRRTINTFLQTRSSVDLDSELQKVRDARVDLLVWDSPGYPRYLKEISHPPPVLYIRGAIHETDEWAIAVVGTRRKTAYGRQVTKDLVRGLVNNNVTIVSGLARGIDSIAHEAAVDMGGRTIAVLGSGLDIIYPSENRTLANRIINGQGALISEFPIGTKPEGKNFPPRNRVISGLSMGVIVVEAKAAVQMSMPESAEEAQLLKNLTHQPVHIDELIQQAGLPSSLVSSTLTLMELKGMVRQVGGMQYVLAREPEPVYDS
jgi:DNA processing protein